MDDIVLYHFPMTRGVRVRWLLNELGKDFTIKVVDVFRGEHLTEEFLAKNRNHNVPMLEFTAADGKRKTMLESGAMVTLIADVLTRADGTKLAPPISSTINRADYLQMIFFGASWMDSMLWEVRLHTHLLPEKFRNPNTVKYYKAKFRAEVQPQLRERLEKHEFICGDKFTACDCLMGYNLSWANAYEMLTDEVLLDYMYRMMQRPACQESIKDLDKFDVSQRADIGVDRLFNESNL